MGRDAPIGTVTMTRLTILSYHNVDGTWAFPSSPGEGAAGFRAQMDWLSRRMNVVVLGDALRRLERGEPLPPRAVAITFDDGYRDNLDVAAAELGRRSLPATFFIVPGLVDRVVAPWWEVMAWSLRCAAATRLTWEGRTFAIDTPEGAHAASREVARSVKRVDRAAREALVADLVDRLRPGTPPPFAELYMDAAGVRALSEQGFEVGSHSAWHSILSRETPQEQAADLSGSRARLQEITGAPVRVLAYPNGTRDDYDDHTLAAARAAGYTHAVTTRVGTNTWQTPPLELRRFVVSPERGTRPQAWASAMGARVIRVARRRLTRHTGGGETRPSEGGSHAPMEVPSSR